MSGIGKSYCTDNLRTSLLITLVYQRHTSLKFNLKKIQVFSILCHIPCTISSSLYLDSITHVHNATSKFCSQCFINFDFQLALAFRKCTCSIKNEKPSEIDFITLIYFENVQRDNGWKRLEKRSESLSSGVQTRAGRIETRQSS